MTEAADRQMRNVARNRSLLARGVQPPEHNAWTYSNWACRCDICRAAWAAWNARRRSVRRIAPDDPRHGRYTTYCNYRCRCDACRAAWAEHSRRRYRSVAS